MPDEDAKKKPKIKRIEGVPDHDVLIDSANGKIVNTRSALTGEDRAHVRNIAIEGESYLDRMGFTQDDRDRFLSRLEVRRELDRIQQQFSDAESIIQRRQFLASTDLAQMLPSAMAVIAKTLKGPNKDNILDYPNPEQIAIAQDILDRCGVSAGGLSRLDANDMQVPAPSLGADQLDDPKRYDMQRVASRESVRRVLETIILRSASTDDRLTKLESFVTGSPLKKKKKKKKRTGSGRFDDI